MQPPRRPNSPSHFIPVQHWGVLVGTRCCPSPALAPWGPACQGWPMGATTPGDVPMKPLSPGLLQCHGCQGACGVLPAPQRARDVGHNQKGPKSWLWTPPVPRAQSRGSSGPSLSPSAHPWVPTHGCYWGWYSCSHQPPLLSWWPGHWEGNIFFGGGSGSPSSHHPHLLGIGTEKGAAEIRGRSGYTRRCQPGWGPPGVPQELRGRAPPAHALGFVSHLRASN